MEITETNFVYALVNDIIEIFRVFVFNTNLTFLYKIDILGFKKFQQKIKLPPVGFELTTATITRLEI